MGRSPRLGVKGDRGVGGRAGIGTSATAEQAKGLEEGSFREGSQGSDHFIEIINGVNYIIFLEFGSSRQAPGGMMRITFKELQMKGVMSKEMSEQLGKTYAQINRRMRTQRAAGRGRGFGAFAAIG